MKAGPRNFTVDRLFQVLDPAEQAGLHPIAPYLTREPRLGAKTIPEQVVELLPQLRIEPGAHLPNANQLASALRGDDEAAKVPLSRGLEPNDRALSDCRAFDLDPVVGSLFRLVLTARRFATTPSNSRRQTSSKNAFPCFPDTVSDSTDLGRSVALEQFAQPVAPRVKGLPKERLVLPIEQVKHHVGRGR